MKNKLVNAILITAMAVSLTACSSKGGNTQSPDTNQTQEQTENKTITITALDANKEEIQVTVPYNPSRIAVLDLAALDIIDALGMGDRITGSVNTRIAYLEEYGENDSIPNIGTIKEANLEAVMACEPDVIFIGARLAASYDALSEIAPVIFLATDYEKGLVESTYENTKTIASLFGLEEQAESLMAGYDKRIEALKALSNGSSALIGMVTSGSFNILGQDGKMSMIGNEIGFTNISSDLTSTHGSESSFETIVSLNPEYIFVLDRDKAIATEGAAMAQDVMNNELVNQTQAYKNNKIIYLENSSVWYTAEGGIQALDIMISDLEKGIAQ